jgi:hypothetical protein
LEEVANLLGEVRRELLGGRSVTLIRFECEQLA